VRLQSRDTAANWPLASALVFAAGDVVISMAGQIIALTLAGESAAAPSVSTLALGALIGAMALIIVLILWGRRRYGAHWLDVLRAGPSGLNLFPYVLIGLGTAWAIDLGGRVLQINTQAVPTVLVALTGPVNLAWVVAALVAVILLPVADTLIFQGIIYPVLSRDLPNNLLAIGGTTVLYAVASLALGIDPWFSLVQPLLMALILTAIRAYTGTLRPVLAARVLFGVFFIFSALLLKV